MKLYTDKEVENMFRKLSGNEWAAILGGGVSIIHENKSYEIKAISKNKKISYTIKKKGW